MNRVKVLMVVVASFAWGAACSSGITGPPVSGGSTKIGGSSGGATRSGGAIVSGGTTSSGGAVGSGGATSTGGAIVSGGTTRSGGAVGSGGATSSGGTSGSGGGTSSGGATSSGGTMGRDAGGGPEVRDGGPLLDGPGTDGSAKPDAPADMAVGGQDGGPEVGSPVDCHTPSAIANGSVSAPVTTLGAAVRYACNAGYSLKGSATRTCQADGTWSGTTPTCSAQTMLTVTINKVGVGTVASTPAGINCGITCQATFATGTIVTLAAVPDANQTFVGWDSTACTGMGTCSFTLTSNTVVRASFSPPPNIMFTTSTTRTPVLGGLSGGDAICATLAANAGLSGTYKAWLSTSTVNAISRLAGASGWVRTDGKPVVNSLADLAQGRLLYPPRLDELGNDLGADPIVMTGTATDGTVMNTFGSYTTCSDFTSTGSLSDMLSSGYASASSDMFTAASSMACSSKARLYCFGVDRQAQVAVTPAVGRYAFVTHLPWSPGGGIGDADVHCQQDASAAALPGTYKALLAPTGVSAASRFDTSGLPWIRTDGIPIAPTAAAFLSATATLFDVPPNVTADGSVYLGYVGVWSGAATPTTAGKGAGNCTNWLSNSATAFAAAGAAGDTAANTFFNMFPADTACGAAFSMHLTCLQE